MFNINEINSNGILNQYINQIHNSNINTLESIYQDKEIGNITSFSQILSKISGKMNGVKNMFQMAFPANDVEIKVGNCNVQWATWERNDFPVWKYFEDKTAAECLNQWRPTGTEPAQTTPSVQQGLNKIKYGEMVILMPNSLQKKIETDLEYAKEVLDKVQKWKENYDREDNAIAVAQGHDTELFQMTKSYCIHLDDDGNIEKHVVIGGGMDTRKTEKSNENDKKATLEKDDLKTEHERKIYWRTTNVATGIESMGHENFNPYVSIYYVKKKE